MFFSSWFGPSITNLPKSPGASRVAITFDDGPSETTPQVLDLLAEYGAHATFFLVGMNTRRLPEIARRVLREGHEVGNHTWSHANFYQRAPWQVRQEIQRAQGAIEDTLGCRPHWFRPPYGVRWFGMFPALRRLEMRCAMWSLDTCDWRDPADAIVERGFRAGDGEVLLLHDGFRTHSGDRRKETVKALPRLLGHFRDRGYQMPTLSRGSSTTP
jgi:peptidoglycan/xylan/chitin deacetylase (PgdA/CDA1 family)